MPHSVEAFLDSHLTQHVSTGRLTHEMLLLSPSNVTLFLSHTLNAATTGKETLLPLPLDEIPMTALISFISY